MSEQAPVRVDVIATTRFEPPADVPWSTDAEGGQALAEFAGRACYHAWTKDRPATATNAGYLRHIVEVGHLAVFEHAQVTLYIRNISRSASHELVRHRHLSYSQLSQRHVLDEPAYVVPDPVADDPELAAEFAAAASATKAAYDRLIDGIERRLEGESAVRRKRARQAAQALLPGARTSEIVVTGNLRAWRQVIAAHGADPAHDELRDVVLACLDALRTVEPNAFGDFMISELPDGRRIASSALVQEG